MDRRFLLDIVMVPEGVYVVSNMEHTDPATIAHLAASLMSLAGQIDYSAVVAVEIDASEWRSG